MIQTLFYLCLFPDSEKGKGYFLNEKGKVVPLLCILDPTSSAKATTVEVFWLAVSLTPFIDNWWRRTDHTEGLMSSTEIAKDYQYFVLAQKSPISVTQNFTVLLSLFFLFAFYHSFFAFEKVQTSLS